MKTKQQYWHMKEHGQTMSLKQAKIALLQGVCVYHPMFEQCNPKIGEYVHLFPNEKCVMYDSCLGAELWDDFWNSLFEKEWQHGWSVWGMGSNFVYSGGPKRFSTIVESYKTHNMAFINATAEQLFNAIYCHLKALMVTKNELSPCTDDLEEYQLT